VLALLPLQASRLSRPEAVAESEAGCLPRRISATGSRGAPALQLSRDSEDAIARELVEVSLWDDTVPGHEWGSSAYMPLKNQLVDFKGYQYGVSQAWMTIGLAGNEEAGQGLSLPRCRQAEPFPCLPSCLPARGTSRPG